MRFNKRAIQIVVAGYLAIVSSVAAAHFQMIIPSDDMVKQSESKKLNLEVLFWHPYEGFGMNMVKPVQFGVLVGGKNRDLLGILKARKYRDIEGNIFDGFKGKYKIRNPGDHIFYTEPQPYWDSSEEVFIVHYTKVIVNAFGLEDGWDKPVGLKTEIIPLTRPYGLYAGNVFQGVVMLNGKPAPGTSIEVEFYNKDGSLKPVADPMITQVVKADSNGLFTYAMPKAGWWAFAALNTDEKTMKHEGEDYPVEIGALLWVKTHEMK